MWGSKGFWVQFTDKEWEILKKYAAAKRKYEKGTGYTVKVAGQELCDAVKDALLNADILDQDGNSVDWKKEF